MNHEAWSSGFSPIMSSPQKLERLKEVITRLNLPQLFWIRGYLAAERTTVDTAVQIISDIALVQTNESLNLTFNGDTGNQKTRALQEMVQAEQANQVRLQDAQKMREHKWRLCADATLRIHQCTSVEEVIEVSGEAARYIVDARQCVMSLKPNEHATERIVAFPPSQEYSANGLAGIVPYVRRRVRQTRTPVRLTHKELQLQRNGHIYAGFELDVMQVNGVLAVPLSARSGCVLGLIQVADKEDGDFSEFDELLVTQLVQNVSVVLENARHRLFVE